MAVENDGRPPDEWPLEEFLADYWKGSFTLREEPDAPPPEQATALAGLGPSGITVRGRELAVLLAPAYEAFTA
ncbi:hypothetical protein [Kitasatospora sp. NPDC057223]|uniref:hypothetical protein n=1 Tax=Kitasatospora sp. NPDC057223 TaxID=3346055 RepID=UPI003645BE70